MRRSITSAALAAAMVLTTGTGALAGHGGPTGSPLPVNGEPHCFGTRVGHSASQHGLTPKAKAETIEGLLAFVGSLPPEEQPPWWPLFADFFADGVSVQRVQEWIRVNCSDEPVLPNP